ncbi:MAG TPA: hypothetical protein VIK96_04655 [Bacilli bacterium]
MHGEVITMRANGIPADAIRIEPTSANYHIVGESETTGNHHVVDFEPESTAFYQTPDGRRFMNSKKPAKIRCFLPERHDEIELTPGCYEFGTQEEYDPFAEQMRKVLD